MSKESPPWTCPAAERVEVGGSNPCGAVGKPRETVGRKATGLRCRNPFRHYVRRVASSKPPETAGRKAIGG